jgi:hypothetical protein
VCDNCTVNGGENWVGGVAGGDIYSIGGDAKVEYMVGAANEAE